MKEITAPYNFVPLSDKVYFPKWSKEVSHDIPLSDGISGTIECTLTAHSPIYVRNGGNWTDDDKKSNPDYFSFFKTGNNDYIIPGTSIKGMIRNVLEIISFGKMGARVDDKRYAMRDLYNSDYQREMTDGSRGTGFSPIPKAGWLSQENGKWIVTPCEFARVEQDDLIKFHGSSPDLKTKQSAVNKYNKWSTKSLDVDFNVEQDSSRNIIYKHTHSCGTLIYKKAINLGKGGLKGTIVFTGQSMNNDGRPGRKHLESFLGFYSPRLAADSIISV